LLAVYTHELKYGLIKKKPRISDFEKDAERLKAANIEEAMGVLVFFYPTFDNLMKIIRPYSELMKQTQKVNQLIEKALTLSLSNTDGYTRHTL
jgi:5-bromo-4-chloroindolyl phosphate hydrolysis protein